MDSEPAVALFVYGTLKKGFPAHEYFFGKDAHSIEAATARGSLFDLPAGYPALAIPETDILAAGTANPSSDMEKQRGTFLARRDPPASGETVHGEVVRFGDSERRLPPLDAFEGFAPGGESLYERVLIPAWTASGEAFPVWAYVMEYPSGARLPDGRWSPSGKETP